MATTSDLVTINSKNHHQTLTERLWNSFLTKTGVDFKLAWAGQTIGAHRFLLDMFLSSSKLQNVWEIMQPYAYLNNDKNLLELLLKFLYTGQLTVAREQLNGLMTMAYFTEFNLLFDILQEVTDQFESVETESQQTIQANNVRGNNSECTRGTTTEIRSEIEKPFLPASYHVSMEQFPSPLPVIKKEKIDSITTCCSDSLEQIPNPLLVIKTEKIDPDEINNELAYLPNSANEYSDVGINLLVTTEMVEQPRQMVVENNLDPVVDINLAVTKEVGEQLNQTAGDPEPDLNLIVNEGDPNITDHVATNTQMELNRESSVLSETPSSCSQWKLNTHDEVNVVYDNNMEVIESCVVIHSANDPNPSPKDRDPNDHLLYHGFEINSRSRRSHKMLTKCPVREYPLKKYPCDQCDSVFTNNYALRQHILSNGDHQLYKCRRCPATFTMDSHLKNHVSRFNSTLGQFCCDQCCSSFDNTGALHEHLLLHKDKLRFDCNTCGKTFTSKFFLWRHRQKLHPKSAAP